MVLTSLQPGHRSESNTHWDTIQKLKATYSNQSREVGGRQTWTLWPWRTWRAVVSIVSWQNFVDPFGFNVSRWVVESVWVRIGVPTEQLATLSCWNGWRWQSQKSGSQLIQPSVCPLSWLERSSVFVTLSRWGARRVWWFTSRASPYTENEEPPILWSLYLGRSRARITLVSKLRNSGESVDEEAQGGERGFRKIGRTCLHQPGIEKAVNYSGNERLVPWPSDGDPGGRPRSVRYWDSIALGSPR